MKQHRRWTGILALALAGVLASAAAAQTPGTDRPHARRDLQLTPAQQQQAQEIRGAARELRQRVRALLATLTPEQRARLGPHAERRLERRLEHGIGRRQAR